MKSRRRKKQHSKWGRYNADPTNFARRIEKVRAAKMAAPRDYPAYTPGSEVVTITISGPGMRHVIEATIPPETGRIRPRSDQMLVREDGEPWPDLGNRTAIGKRVAALILRRFSRDELATMG